jgi:hypothetical protein
MEDIGENIKYVKKNGEVQLKLYNKDSASLLSIFLTARGIEFRFIQVHDEDDLFYNSDNKEEHIFWIKEEDWNYLKHDICWEKE